MSVKVTLPDGSVREVMMGTTVEQLAGQLSAGLKKKAIAGILNGKPVDLSFELSADANVRVLTPEDDEALAIMRHSTAHLLAQALKRLYGGAAVKLGVGPVVEDGFYYDVDVDVPVSAEDLANIELEMEKIVKENLPIERLPVSREEAVRRFEAIADPYKLELIRELPDDKEITIYEQGEFFDLCRGPHVPSTGRIGAFKLLSIAGAYWRGDAKNKMLQRIYGTAFAKKAQLEEHLKLLEEAKRRDHRKLGRELGLFMFSEEAPGMPFYLPKGVVLRNELVDFSRHLQTELGYREVRTPIMMNRRLWEQSGHWEHYHENMYFSEVDDIPFALKPMNCPGHMLIYKNELHSYRDLPIRLADYGDLHRHEYSGALSGMLRVRSFCQDDAHLFVRPEQIEAEIGQTMDLIDRMYRVFCFEYKVELSTRPEDSMGAIELWNQAESALQRVLENRGVAYRVNEGDGAFYGPKIDFHVRDALKRSWQCATIQLDFQMPEKFDLHYIGEDNRKYRPVVIHRAVYGSIDRFIGILTEHYAGHFPVWLSPVQAKLLPVSPAFSDYAHAAAKRLRDAGIRIEVDARGEKLGFKIREAQLEKVPYMLIAGEKEAAAGTLSVRKHGSPADIGALPIDDVISRLQSGIANKL